jgi:hypothetical protein
VRRLRPRSKSATQAHQPEGMYIMDWKLEVVVVPVTDYGQRRTDNA